MNEILIQDAQAGAVARLVKVLRARFNAEAAALNASRTPPLPIKEVPPDAVWRLGVESDIDQSLKLHGISIFVMPTGAAELSDARTGSSVVFGKLDRSTWRVLLMFSAPGAFVPPVYDGVPLRPSEMAYEVALLYKAALILTLSKYATDSDAVHELKILDSYADYVPLANAALTGRAALTIEVTQNVLLPQPIWDAV